MIRVAIVEDEQNSRDKLQRYLARYSKEHGTVFDAEVFTNGAEFVFNYHSGFDMILMDIEMPFMNGMDAARRIRETDADVIIVFITNMANYAVQGYEVEAMDFIVKPFTYEVFKFRIERVIGRIERTKSNYAIVLNSNDRAYRVNVADLLYVEVYNHALIYHTTTESISVRGSLMETAAMLCQHGFCRCSQSYLVNLRYITRVETEDVWLGDIQLHISRGKKKELIRALTEYMAKG